MYARELSQGIAEKDQEFTIFLRSKSNLNYNLIQEESGN